MASSFGVIPNIRNNFDYLVAADTNTETLNNMKISITTSYFTPNILESDKKVLHAEHFHSWIIFDCIDELNPERLGWDLTIKAYNEKNGDDTKRIGVVVDSELGLLDSMNQRKIPYFPENFLPKNMQLLYASETESNSFPNDMIKHCDNISRKILAQISAPNYKIPFPKNGDAYHKGHLLIKIENPK